MICRLYKKPSKRIDLTPLSKYLKATGNRCTQSKNKIKIPRYTEDVQQSITTPYKDSRIITKDYSIFAITVNDDGSIECDNCSKYPAAVAHINEFVDWMIGKKMLRGLPKKRNWVYTIGHIQVELMYWALLCCAQIDVSGFYKYLLGHKKDDEDYCIMMSSPCTMRIASEILGGCILIDTCSIRTIKKKNPDPRLVQFTTEGNILLAFAPLIERKYKKWKKKNIICTHTHTHSSLKS